MELFGYNFTYKKSTAHHHLSFRDIHIHIICKWSFFFVFLPHGKTFYLLFIYLFLNKGKVWRTFIIVTQRIKYHAVLETCSAFLFLNTFL